MKPVLFLVSVALASSCSTTPPAESSPGAPRYRLELQLVHPSGQPYVEDVAIGLRQVEGDAGSLGVFGKTPTEEGNVTVEFDALERHDVLAPLIVEARAVGAARALDAALAREFVLDPGDGAFGARSGRFAPRDASGVHVLSLGNLVLTPPPLFAHVEIEGPGAVGYRLRVQRALDGDAQRAAAGDTFEVHCGVIPVYSTLEDERATLAIFDLAGTMIYSGALERGGSVRMNPNEMARFAVTPTTAPGPDVIGLFVVPVSVYPAATLAEESDSAQARARLMTTLRPYRMTWQSGLRRYFHSSLKGGDYVVELWKDADLESATTPFQPSYSTTVTLAGGQIVALTLP